MSTNIAPLVLFDLDGTLVDSAVDQLNALNRVVVDAGRPALPLAAIRPVVSKGARAMLGVAFSDESAEVREARVAPFLAYYAEAVAHHSTPFAGIESVLGAIEGQGARWGIVTNKPLYLARGVVDSMGWRERCAILIGGDSLPRKKPDPLPLQTVCADFGLKPAQVVAIGDSSNDAQAARAAGCPVLTVPYGYNHGEAIHKTDSDGIVATLLDAAILIRSHTHR